MTLFSAPGFYATRDGSKAEVFKEVDGKLWGRALCSGLCGDEWISWDWDIGGRALNDGKSLVAPWKEVPSKVEGWVNVGRSGWFSPSYDEKQMALGAAMHDSDDRIACRRITYQAGVRLSEDELEFITVAAFMGCPGSPLESLPVALSAYLDAWKQGRIIDTTPEDGQ